MSALARRRTAGAAVALLVLFALQFVVFAAPPAAAQTDEGATTTGFFKKDISAKVGDYDCDNNEWHFVITGLTLVDPPDSITVTFGSGAVVDVPLDKVTGHTAHYLTTGHLDDTVVSATASIFFLWNGQFNLSHGPCPTEKEASITVVKDVPGDGGQEQFLFSLSTVDDFWLADGGSKSFDFRWAYDGRKHITVSEHDDLLGDGWSFVDVVCVDGSGRPAEVLPGSSPAQVEVLLDDGGDYTCTFTNEFEKTTSTTEATTTTTTTSTVPTSTTTSTVPTSTTTTTAVPTNVQGIQVTTTSTTIPFDPQVEVAGIQVTPSTTIPAVSAETLPFTGAEVGEIALFGLAALGGGGLLVYGARKKDDGDDTGATSTL